MTLTIRQLVAFPKEVGQGSELQNSGVENAKKRKMSAPNDYWNGRAWLLVHVRIEMDKPNYDTALSCVLSRRIF